MKANSGLPFTPGFSLVEVALSLAILAVGMVGVLALLPVGLESARQVHAEAVMANVVRTSLSDFSTNAWTDQSFRDVVASPPTELFTVEGRRPVPNDSAITNLPYFRLEYQLVSSDANSAIFRLRLRWPDLAVQANSNSPIIQRRFFFARLNREF